MTDGATNRNKTEGERVKPPLHYSAFDDENEEAAFAREVVSRFRLQQGIKNKCLFLDRDGTINVFNVGSNFKKEHIELIPGVAELIARFISDGYKIIVITNQGGIGKGVYTESDLYCVNELIDRLLREKGAHIDAVYYCPHFAGGIYPYNKKCECRKPESLLLRRAIKHFNADTEKSLFIGDNFTDKACAEKCNVRFYPFEFRRVRKTSHGFRFVIKEYDNSLINDIFDFAANAKQKT